MKKINRRDLIKTGSGLAAASIFLNKSVLADEDKPQPRSNKFLLSVPFGSSCGVANGLIQPVIPGQWPAGFFERGSTSLAANPLLNAHTKAGNMVFHDYTKFLANMANDMCLVNGTPQSLDHNVARNIQMRGNAVAAFGPEWAMGVSQFMRSDSKKNPMIITRGERAASAPDITTIQATSLLQFQTITSDVDSLKVASAEPILKVLRSRFKGAALDTVQIEPSLGENADNQLNILFKGLPEINAAKEHIDTLTAKMSAAETTSLISTCIDKVGILPEATAAFRDQLILAGILAKTGLAHGMSVDVIGDDLHNGGADVDTARRASGKWAQIAQFWQWIRSVGLQNDVMIIVSQEFARSPYNLNFKDVEIINAKGEKQMIRAFGRDHGLSMGTMFINANVPKAGRIGMVSGNFVAQATKDSKGTIDAAASAYTAENVVGSMLMRVFDDLFPTERMVRKHWPSFVEISPILA
ncbi:MAG: hypothetical protein NTX25_16780 [Proteobacteria bacterium]|nr:hypothetical protein [Pseudomonadota bacterium]